MKRVDAAHLEEVMPRSLRVELVLSERLFARQQPELTFMHFDHERILLPADRAIAHREFGEICFDLESNGAAVATAPVFLHWPCSHGFDISWRLTFEMRGLTRLAGASPLD